MKLSFSQEQDLLRRGIDPEQWISNLKPVVLASRGKPKTSHCWSGEWANMKSHHKVA